MVVTGATRRETPRVGPINWSRGSRRRLGYVSRKIVSRNLTLTRSRLITVYINLRVSFIYTVKLNYLLSPDYETISMISAVTACYRWSGDECRSPSDNFTLDSRHNHMCHTQIISPRTPTTPAFCKVTAVHHVNRADLIDDRY